ncbi:hypothetical protein LCGC14_2672730, partial [marine sediment metagenome]
AAELFPSLGGDHDAVELVQRQFFLQFLGRVLRAGFNPVPLEVAPLDQLDDLSRTAGGQQQDRRGAGGQRPSERPATTSDAKSREGEARRPDMARMQEVMKKLWGELPQRDREQMLQSPPEEFLPKYELLIEQYFRRLTEGNDEL